MKRFLAFRLSLGLLGLYVGIGLAVPASGSAVTIGAGELGGWRAGERVLAVQESGTNDSAVAQEAVTQEAVAQEAVAAGVVTAGGATQEDVAGDKSAHGGVGGADEHGETETLAGHSLHGEVFNEGPRQAAELIPGTGEVDFPVSTGEPLAQQYFNQGVGQLHGFWYFEAERSFRQAAAIDPTCSMFYWGMAMANLKNPTRALKFVAEAKERWEPATPREKKWIEAVERFCTTKDSEGKEIPAEKRAQQYTRDLEDVIFLQPDDLEAKAFLVGHLWENQRGALATVSHVAVNALLQQIFDVAPLHPAHHYRIHLWDQRDAKQALASAALCGPSAPGVAHMWHMPGHIYSALNRHDDAVWQMEASARVDHQHMMRYGVLPDQIHNYAHNNEWLSRNLLKVGRVHAALELADNMLSLPRHPQYNTGDKGSGRYGRQRSLGALTSYRIWDELLQRADRIFWDAAIVPERQWEKWQHVGMAAAYLQREDESQAALTALQAALDERLERQAAANREAETEEGSKAEAAAKSEQDAQAATAAEGTGAEVTATEGNVVRDQATTDQLTTDQATTDQSTTDQATADQATTDQATTDQATRDQATTDQTTANVQAVAADQPAEATPTTVVGASEASTSEGVAGGTPRRGGRRRGRGGLEQEIETLQKAVASIRAVQAAVACRWDEALELAEKSSGLDDLVKAEWQGAAGRWKEAWEAVNREVERRPNDVVPLASKVFLAQQWLEREPVTVAAEATESGAVEATDGGAVEATDGANAEVAEGSDAQAADELPVTWESLRADFERLRQWAGRGDLESPLLARLSALATRYELPTDWRLPAEVAADVGERPELDTLGPAHWTPVPAPPLVVWDAAGHESRPLESTGKAKLVMFYLGFGCLHCMEQLQKFSPRGEDFAAAGVELVAVSSESVELLQQGLQNFEQSLTFPLHADRELAAFRAFRCYDDFESQPLHGTFLLGPDGRILWQDIGHEPFMDVDFLLGEVPRLLQVWAP